MARPRLAALVAVSLSVLTFLLLAGTAFVFVDLHFPRLKLPLARRGITLDPDTLEALRQELELEMTRDENIKLKKDNALLRKDLAELHALCLDTRRSLKEKEIALARLEEKDSHVLTLIAGAPMPAIDAKVTAVRSDIHPTLLLLSVGTVDKVEKGFQFSIYRGTDFIGKVVVEKVLQNKCGCRVLFTKDGQEIRAGDAAATRLQ